MSIFGNIMGKIFNHADAPQPPPQTTQAEATPTPAPTPASAPTPAAAPAAAPAEPVDVGAVLSAMAAMKDGGNYQSSIVDLLKLLDLDSSLAARRELGQELGVHAGEDGSAEQNIALHEAVMDKLAQNGGIVPDSLRS